MRLVLLVALLLPLAGCAQPEEAPAQDPPPQPAQDAPPEEEAPASPPPASTPPPAQPTSPPPAPPEENVSGEEPAPAEPPQPRTEEVAGEAMIPAELAPPCNPPAPCAAGVPAPPASLAFTQARPALATLTATWTSQDPVPAPALHVEVATPEGVVVGAGNGTSPLVLTLDAGLLGAATEVVVSVKPEAPGAAVQQKVALLLVLEHR